MITENEGFFMACGAGIKSIRGSALNLSPLARLLRPDQLIALMSPPVFITAKEILASPFFLIDIYEIFSYRTFY